MKPEHAHVTIVDDEAHVLDLLKDFLEAEGHVVSVAASGEEALKLDDLPRTEVALIDIHLRGKLSGHELVEQLNSAIPDAAKILMSGRGEIDDLISAFESQVFSFVNKPFKSLKEIDLLIRRAAESKRHEITNRRYTQELEVNNVELEQKISARTADLERMRNIVSHLFSVSTRLGSIEPLDSLLNYLCESIVTAGAFRRAVVLLADEKFLIRHMGAAEQDGSSASLLKRIQSYRDLPLRPFDFGREGEQVGSGYFSHRDAEAPSDVHGADGWRPGDQLSVPLRRHDGRVFGYLSVDHPHDDSRPSEEIVKYLDILLRHSTLHVEAREIREELSRKADDLERKVEDRTRELRQSQEKFSRLVNLTTDIVYITDANWKIIYLNDAFANSLGYVRENYIGLRLAAMFEDLVTDEPDNREQIKLLTRDDDDQSMHHVELLTRHGDKRIFEINRTVVRQGGEIAGSQGIARDVTEQRALMKRVMSTERLAASGRLAAGIAHEINNPLQAITSHVNALRDSKQGAAKEHTAQIKEGIDRIRMIVRGMLDLHRTQAAATVEINLNSLIEKVLALAGRQLRAGDVEVEQNLAGDLRRFKGAPQDLQQVILNLILNASDAMPDGGVLSLSTRNEEGAVVASISDTGLGISEENLKRIFEPFYSARIGGGGVGLGLYLSKNIVEIHQGSITAESTPGKGTTFTLRFPT